MWSYYGAKGNLVDYYPPPKHDKIIEPFAGTAKYSLKYWDRDVLLIDKYDVIVKIWKWLQKCSPKDVLSLPRKVPVKARLEDFKFDCEEAKLLFGFLIGKGSERPRASAPDRMAVRRPNHANYHIQEIAKNLFKIKHWTIIEGDYRDVENKEATWFIDPPYQKGGDVYVKNNKRINYEELGMWCKSRQGQIIVCENSSATWLPFKKIKRQRGSIRSTTEMIWCNHQTVYDYTQSELF